MQQDNAALDIEQTLTQNLINEERNLEINKSSMNDFIEKNKNTLKCKLIICNFIHVFCFTLLDQIEFLNDSTLYPNSHGFKQQKLLFNLSFQIPLFIILPVLLGYARDFIKQVATIKITFAMIFIGIILQNCSMFLQLYQVELIGQFMFNLGKEIFFVAGLCFINDYYPHKPNFAQILASFSQFGWCLPHFLANLIMVFLSCCEYLNNKVVESLKILLLINFLLLIFEITQIYQVLKIQNILEQTEESNITNNNNPLKKHNILNALKKYFQKYHLILIILSISCVISSQNFGYMNSFNVYLSQLINEGKSQGPSYISYVLTSFQAMTDFTVNQLLKNFYKNKYKFSKVVQFIQTSGFLAIIFYTTLIFQQSIPDDYLPRNLILVFCNIVSGLISAFSYSTIEIIVQYFQIDYMIGTGFGLASSCMNLFATISGLILLFQNDTRDFLQSLLSSYLMIAIISFAIQYFIDKEMRLEYDFNYIQQQSRQDLVLVLNTEEYVQQKVKKLIKQNKKYLVKNLKICNSIHNCCYFFLELLQSQYYGIFYPKSTGSYLEEVQLYYSLAFVIPFNFLLPILLGYARDFVNQVVTIKISFSLVCLGIFLQYLSLCFGLIQPSMVGVFMFMLGKEVFFVAGLTLIYDYYPKIENYSVVVCTYCAYGWSLPRILANVLMLVISQIKGAAELIYEARQFILLNSILLLLIEKAFLNQIIKSQQQLEDTEEINIRDYKNPFRKHNLFLTLKKYLKSYEFMYSICSISIVIGIQNTQFVSIFSSNLINYLKSQNNENDDIIVSTQYILSLIQAASQLFFSLYLGKIFKQNFTFNKVLKMYAVSGICSFLFFTLSFTQINIFKNNPFVSIGFQAINNVLSGMALAYSFITIEIIVVFFHQDYMIGTGFGLASSFIMLFWTLSVTLIKYYSYEYLLQYTAVLLGVSFYSFLATNLIGRFIEKKYFQQISN
ncbi:hypothetical protein ABPG74_015072 [Tetrahymena malaccensis]